MRYHFTGPAPDSMRTEVDGNLYVAMYGQGRVLVFTRSGIPIGQVLLPGRDQRHDLLSTSMAIRPGTHKLYTVTSDGDRGQGATIFLAGAFAPATRLYSHQYPQARPVCPPEKQMFPPCGATQLRDGLHPENRLPWSMPTPERTSAAAFAHYTADRPVQDSATLNWTGLFVRRYGLPCVVERFLVPATPEPLISCGLAGSAEFCEREPGGEWINRQIGLGHIFVTRSKTPYEVDHVSRPGEALETVQVHVAVDAFLTALREAHPGRDGELEVADFFGEDPGLALLCRTAAQLLEERVPGTSQRVEKLTQLLAAYLSEKHVEAADKQPDFRSGLPVWQLRKVQQHVQEHMAEEIGVDRLADVAGLSPAHFSRVFKQATGLSPLRYVTRQRITLAQQLIRETSRSLIDIGLEVGYESPSHFAKVFRQVTGVTPTVFRQAL